MTRQVKGSDIIAKGGPHLSVRVKGQTGHSVRVDILQDGHGLHGVRVPDTDERVLPHLTRRHLDLIGVERQAGGGAQRDSDIITETVTRDDYS